MNVNNPFHQLAGQLGAVVYRTINYCNTVVDFVRRVVYRLYYLTPQQLNFLDGLERGAWLAGPYVFLSRKGRLREVPAQNQIPFKRFSILSHSSRRRGMIQ